MQKPGQASATRVTSSPFLHPATSREIKCTNVSQQPGTNERNVGRSHSRALCSLCLRHWAAVVLRNAGARALQHRFGHQAQPYDIDFRQPSSRQNHLQRYRTNGRITTSPSFFLLLVPKLGARRASALTGAAVPGLPRLRLGVLVLEALHGV
jgi:hypothetical protein